jgi:hypothetical protein
VLEWISGLADLDLRLRGARPPALLHGVRDLVREQVHPERIVRLVAAGTEVDVLPRRERLRPQIARRIGRSPARVHADTPQIDAKALLEASARAIWQRTAARARNRFEGRRRVTGRAGRGTTGDARRARRLAGGSARRFGFARRAGAVVVSSHAEPAP